MSDLIAIVVTLATYGLGTICVVLLVTRAHLRMDEIVTGVANGTPISIKYRWLLLFYDFWSYVGGASVVLAVFGIGFHRAAEISANPSVGAVANLCAIACVVMLVILFVLCLPLTYYMVSVLREAKRD